MWGTPSCLPQTGCRAPADQGPARAGNPNTVPECCPARASEPPGTDNSAAGGWGSHRNGRQWDGGWVGRRRRSRFPARWHAGRWPGGRCPHPLPYPVAGGPRSRAAPRNSAEPGSGPERSRDPELSVSLPCLSRRLPADQSVCGAPVVLRGTPKKERRIIRVLAVYF